MRSFSSRVAWVAVVIAAGGCATPGEPPAPAPPFPEVKSAALVRWRGRGAERPKDALDALDASLAERGIATRAVELGRDGTKELREVERLYAIVESRVQAGAGIPGRSRAAQPLGPQAGEVVRALGADAVALYLRFDDRLGPRGAAAPPPPPPPFGQPPPLGEARPISSYRPAAAVALVSRDGALVWFDWGRREDSRDPEGPVNAAEAVDAAARLLAGEREDG